MRMVDAGIDDRDDHPLTLKVKIVPNARRFRHFDRVHHTRRKELYFLNTAHTPDSADFRKISALGHDAETVHEIAETVQNLRSGNVLNLLDDVLL